MVDDFEYNRRELLEMSGTTLAAITGATSLAGCSGDDSTEAPTETATSTSSPTPGGENQGDDTGGNDSDESQVNYSGSIDGPDSEITSNTSFSFEASPIDSLESVKVMLESGDDHPLHQETPVKKVLYDSSEQGLPSDGSVEVQIPYRPIWEAQGDHIQQLYLDDTINWEKIEEMWNEAGGEFNIIAEANFDNNTLTKQQSIQLGHPRKSINLQEHNQRTNPVLETLPEGEYHQLQGFKDFELLRKLAKPYMRTRWHNTSLPIKEDEIYAISEFDAQEGYLEEQETPDQGFGFWITTDPTEIWSFLDDLEVEESRHGYDVYRSERDEWTTFVDEFVYDPERNLLLTDTGANREIFNPAIRPAVDALAGEVESLEDAKGYSGNDRYSQRFKMRIQTGPDINNLGYDTTVIDALNMAEWHPENPAEYLGEEYADRHPASGYWKVMMKLDDPEFGRSGPGDLPDAMKEHYFQEDE